MMLRFVRSNPVFIAAGIAAISLQWSVQRRAWGRYHDENKTHIIHSSCYRMDDFDLLYVGTEWYELIWDVRPDMRYDRTCSGAGI